MTGVALELRSSPPAAVDAAPLLPERINGFSVDELARIRLGMGRHAIAVGDLFRIRTHEADELRLLGDCRLLARVGASMRSGILVVEGPVGDSAGRGMHGGRLTIEGSAGDRCAAGLQGGEVRVGGDVGDFAAGPLPGERSGMRGGRLVIGGGTGRRLAYRLRRGTVIVRGPLGAAPAAHMIAGTVAALTPFPPDTGIGIRRGTLLSAARSQPPGGDRFTPAEPCQLDFLRLLVHDLATDLPELGERFDRPGITPLRALGDQTTGGRAEWIAPSARP